MSMVRGDIPGADDPKRKLRPTIQGSWSTGLSENPENIASNYTTKLTAS